jgi:hypothetical protein
MTGECSAKFHTHAKVEITPISHIGYVPVAGYISFSFFSRSNASYLIS